MKQPGRRGMGTSWFLRRSWPIAAAPFLIDRVRLDHAGVAPVIIPKAPLNDAVVIEDQVVRQKLEADPAAPADGVRLVAREDGHVALAVGVRQDRKEA